MHKVRFQGINAALISAFFLGLAPVFGKAAMGPDHFSALAVVALRTGMAALLLFLIMAIFERRFIFIYPAGLLGCHNHRNVGCLRLAAKLIQHSEAVYFRHHEIQDHQIGKLSADQFNRFAAVNGFEDLEIAL